MKRWVLAAVAAVAFTGPASAAVVTLQSVATNGANNFTFNYQGTLGPDEGLRTGDRLVIFDFAGYIPNSISADGNANVTASIENTSANVILTPGQTDDPNIPNLVFTYTGPAFQTSGGPFPSIDFSGLSARSTLGGTKLDAFFTLTTKNNPAAEAGTAAFQIGTVRVPSAAAAVPEPATWAMMLGGFGLLGAASRRRTRMTSVAA